MSSHLSDILAACLESIEKGERTVEECLSLYPDHRKDLEPLLWTMAVIREGAGYRTRPGYLQSSRTRVIDRLTPRAPSAPQKPFPRSRHRVPVADSKRFGLQWVAALVLAISLVGAGTAYAAREALPGDVLYPVKLSLEDARLFISNDAEDVSLATEFMQIRMEEIQALIEAEREEDLQLAVDLLSNRISVATEALAASAQDEPDRTAQLALVLENALSTDTQVLATQLESVPDQAKPAIQRAILASNEGRQAVQDLIRDEESPVGPPDSPPGQDGKPPGGGRPTDDKSSPGKHPTSSPSGGRPVDPNGPPTRVPDGRP